MKQKILNEIEDLCTNFIYYNRKEDNELSVEQLNEAVKSGEITVDEIVDEFRKHIEASYGSQNKIKLADVNWLCIGKTNEYSELKKRIAHICRDVTNAGCIDEICINDIVYTFRQLGYEVVKVNN